MKDHGFAGWQVPLVGAVLSLLLAGNLFFAQRFMDEVKAELKELKSQTAGMLDLRIEVVVLKNAVAQLQQSIEKRRN